MLLITKFPMPRFLLAVTVLLALGFQPGLAFAEPAIKLMSYNIRYGSENASNEANAWVSSSGKHRRDLVVSVIKDYSPDILGVQESLLHQVSDLKNAMPDYGFSGVGRDDGIDAGEHSGIFYRKDRFTVSKEGTFWLSNSPDVPSKFPEAACIRIASWIILEDIQAKSEEYFVLNTHWDHVCQPARVFSATLIRDRIRLLAGERPVVVMGDMNAKPHNDAMKELLGLNHPTDFQLQDSYQNISSNSDPNEGTYNGFRGEKKGGRIDYILHNDSFATIKTCIIRKRINDHFPSDHFPITSTLERNQNR